MAVSTETDKKDLALSAGDEKSYEALEKGVLGSGHEDESPPAGV